MSETAEKWGLPVALVVFGLVWVFNAYKLGRLKMTVKQARKVRDWLMIAGFFIMLGAYVYEPLLVIGAVVMCSGLVPHFLFNRCPHCGQQLGRNEADYCQFCGKRIE